jgi:hypothetical protein
MTKVQSIVSLGLITTSLLLTACHENPLHKHRKEANANFLRDAAFAASKELHVSPLTAGRTYMGCMDGDKTTAACKRLFLAMLSYAKERTSYADLSYQDLTDTKTYIDLAEDYENKLFNTLDY